MKGHVPTPRPLADRMVAKLFQGNLPQEGSSVLFPGVGTGPFAEAVSWYCKQQGIVPLEGVGVETNRQLLAEARRRIGATAVELVERDFLSDVRDLGTFEYVIGNPPYVPIERLSEDEKRAYRSRFTTAVGRFDLYILFFEQAVRLLKEGGRLVFITPEKFEYVETARPLRQLLARYHVREIEHVAEDVFQGYVTYPTITVLDKTRPGKTLVTHRDGETRNVALPRDGTSWASVLRGHTLDSSAHSFTLGELCQRISCGVATGADGVFVKRADEVPPELESWSYPTVSGKQLGKFDEVDSEEVFVSPYREDGTLPPENELGAYAGWARRHRERLEARSCVAKGHRPWYGWHENPPMRDIRQPKILCKDVTSEPKFWLDAEGKVVPRHSVYYIVPKPQVDVHKLLAYLNSGEAREWLEAHCQRAANGYYRLQSRVLRQLRVPKAVLAESIRGRRQQELLF